MRNLVAVASFAIACLASSGSAYARQAIAADRDVCASATTTIAIETCQSDQLANAARDLNDLTVRIDDHLRADTATRQAFDAAQAAWRTDLKLTCDNMDSIQYGQGSAARTEPLRCAVVMTHERTALLRTLFYVMLND